MLDGGDITIVTVLEPKPDGAVFPLG
jgi:hypothetical protein